MAWALSISPLSSLHTSIRQKRVGSARADVRTRVIILTTVTLNRDAVIVGRVPDEVVKAAFM